jgi:Ni/Co efflux regulator RcnB
MRNLVLSLIGLLLFTVPVQADDVATSVAREGVKAAFEEFERQMIYKYFGEHVYHHEDRDYDHDYDKKAKKDKKKGLPPGIQKKLDRGGTLPPGIAKRYLPDDLEHRLPPPPHGYERTVVGSDVLLVEIDTGRIADIVTDAIIGD